MQHPQLKRNEATATRVWYFELESLYCFNYGILIVVSSRKIYSINLWWENNWKILSRSQRNFEILCLPYSMQREQRENKYLNYESLLLRNASIDLLSLWLKGRGWRLSLKSSQSKSKQCDTNAQLSRDHCAHQQTLNICSRLSRFSFPL